MITITASTGMIRNTVRNEIWYFCRVRRDSGGYRRPDVSDASDVQPDPLAY